MHARNNFRNTCRKQSKRKVLNENLNFKGQQSKAQSSSTKLNCGASLLFARRKMSTAPTCELCEHKANLQVKPNLMLKVVRTTTHLLNKVSHLYHNLNFKGLVLSQNLQTNYPLPLRLVARRRFQFQQQCTSTTKSVLRTTRVTYIP